MHTVARGGFTFIELTIAIVIISIGLTGSIFALTTVSKHSADPLIRQQASSIAKSYMEEVMSKQFPSSVPCAAPPSNNRAMFTQICDYDGLNDIGVRDQNGQSVDGLSAYNVAVKVDTAGAVLGELASGTQVLRIDITVSHALLTTPMVLNAYKTSY